VIDELEERRAKGKSDYVAKLADEIEKGGIAAWKSLNDLLPADDVQPAVGNAQFNFGSVFVAAVKQMSERHSAVGASAIEGPGLPLDLINYDGFLSQAVVFGSDQRNFRNV
jgi:hypothetical protein